MNTSLYLGRVFGITVRMHYLFLVMMGALFLIGGPSTLLLTSLLFVLVLLHELGHSLVAQHFGIRVLDITFWPLGGMARMSEIPEDSKIEGWIAIAGPLVNFALAGLAIPLAMLSAPPNTEAFRGHGALGWSEFVALFFAMNLALGLFNLVPAFPMDGGRVLRALLARKGGWLWATEQAVRVGRWLAFGMVLLAFPTRNCFLPLIGVFVWWTGTRELWMVRLRHGAGATMPFPNMPGFGPFQPPTPGSPGDPMGPISEERPEAPGGGFSESDIERLERFRGRLRGTEPGSPPPGR